MKKKKGETFSKEQFTKSKTFFEHRDLLEALLDEEKVYSKKEVTVLLDAYMNKSMGREA